MTQCPDGRRMSMQKQKPPTAETTLRQRCTFLRCAPLVAILFMALAAGSASAQGNAPDGRGPVAGWEGRIQINSEGVQALGPAVLPLPDLGPWQPQWIWATQSAGASGAQFRKVMTFAAGATIKTAIAKITADRIYRFWVNGRLVSRGPDDPGFDVILSQNWTHQWLYDEVEIAPYLHAGENVLAVEVLTQYSPSYSLKHAGFAFELTATTSVGTTQHIESDAGWQAQPLNAYAIGPIAEGSMLIPSKKPETGILYDARKDSSSWREAGTSILWEHAVPIPSVWGVVMASRIPQTMEAVYPVLTVGRTLGQVTISQDSKGAVNKVRVVGDGSFSVDYDRVLSAYASFRVHGPAGAIVTLQTAETRTNPNPRRSAQITLKGGETVFEQPVYDAFSTFRVTVTHADGPVEFSDLRATFVSQPVVYRGSFNTSDEGLNRLWKAARWATQICMQNHYLDSPNHQEPIGDFGDYLIESKENDYAFQAQALTRQDLKKFALLLDHSDSSNFHTSYSLLWLQMLLDYYDWTGDLQLVTDLKPTVDRLLAHFATFVGNNGILSEAPNYMFMDWVTIGGFPTHHPPAVIGQGYLTAFYYRGLADGARIADITQDVSHKQKYEQLRSQLKAAFERELWDEKAGLYRDGKANQNHQPIGKWLPQDKDIETHSTHVNSLAVLYDLAPQDRQRKIMDRLADQPKLNVQPYFMHFVFDAEAHAGIFNRVALSQLSLWQLNPETQTFPENFGGGDLSHAWGGTPLIQMSSRILGVTEARAGPRRLIIEPMTAGLSFAKGVVPTTEGEVVVEWTATNGEFALEVKLPSTETAEVILPGILDYQTEFFVDGKRHSNKTITLKGGTHRLVSRRSALSSSKPVRQ